MNPEEKIQQCLCGQPPVQYFLQTITKDQTEVWFSLKVDWMLLAIAWKARMSGMPDPLAPCMKLGGMTKRLYHLTWLQVDWLEQLWGLVQLGFPYIEQAFEDEQAEFPFESALDLYLKLIEEMACVPLEHASLPYFEFSPRKVKKLMKLCLKATKGKSLSVVEEKFCNEVMRTWNLSSLKWNPTVMVICRLVPPRQSPSLRSKLNSVYNAQEAYCNFLVKGASKSPSFAWKSGERGWATIGGSYNFS